MYPIHRNCTLFAGLILCVLAIIALSINQVLFHFQGNDYFPEGTYSAGFYLFIIYVGVKTIYSKNHYITKFVQYFVTFYFVMSAIALMTNAVQYTPFPPIDKHLVAFENLLGINMAEIIAWTNRFPPMQKLLTFIYDTLPYQMSILPIAAAAAGAFDKLDEFFCLLLISALIGFTFYYFFPTTAPASVIQSPFFLPEQYATGLKFSEIHQQLKPSTIDGGLIALPSFHTIWAWLCLYLIRPWKVLFFLLLPVNALLVLSCVLLGWHYPIDILGSIIVLLITHAIYNMGSSLRATRLRTTN